jgi:predicted RNase H-related nuclease YkuK (DUF458 family)
MKSMNIDEVKRFIDAQPEGTKVYIGADSQRYRVKGQWFADYTLAVVVHIAGKHGCKVFGEVQTERDYDQRKDRPAIRLMNEVYKVGELFSKLRDVLADREIEVHLDINPDKAHGSSCVVEQAIGYIRGTCNVVPLVKPESWAASHVADRLKSIVNC